LTEKERELKVLAKDIKRIFHDLEILAKETNLPVWQLLPLVTFRELIILNTQVGSIHEHLDWLYEQKKEKPNK